MLQHKLAYNREHFGHLLFGVELDKLCDNYYSIYGKPNTILYRIHEGYKFIAVYPWIIKNEAGDKFHPSIIKYLTNKYFDRRFFQNEFLILRNNKIDCDYAKTKNGLFLYLSISSEHGLNLKPYKKELLLLFSGALQLGEACNLRNYRAYREIKNIKYLPFVLGSSQFYYMPLLNKEGFEQGLENFVVVCEKLEQMSEQIPIILKNMKNVIELEEMIVKIETGMRRVEKNIDPILPSVNEVSKTMRALLTIEQEKLRTVLRPFSKKLSFVYRGLKGPKDVVVIP